MEDHDDASLMLGDDEHHHHPHHHDPHHHHEDNEHEIDHDEEDEHDEDEEDEDMDIEPTRIEGVSHTPPAPLDRDEFWDHEPSKDELWEMKKANKRPSEWLKLLCKDWAETGENLELIETVDPKFKSYKPYLKGKLSSQLLCRLCIPSESGSAKDKNNNSSSASNSSNNTNKPDFLRNVLGIQDEFDQAYVIAQVERFCALYDIRGIQQQTEATAAAAAASATAANNINNNNTVAANNNCNSRFALANNEATAAAAAALYGDLVVNALGSVSDVHQQAIAAAAAVTANAATHHSHINHSHAQIPSVAGIAIPAHFLTADATAAAVAAAQQAQAAQQSQAATAAAAAVAGGTITDAHKAPVVGGWATQVEGHKAQGGPSRSTAAGLSGSAFSHPHHTQADTASTNHAVPHTTTTTTTTQVFANSRSAQALLTKAQQQAKSAERALEHERRQNAKREQKRLSHDKKLAKQRDREFLQKRKQTEKLAREKAREEKRTRKLLQRQQRECFAQEQKEAALRRAADLVASNRVPIEITRVGAFRNRGGLRKQLPLPGMSTSAATSSATATSTLTSTARATTGANSTKRKAPRASVVPTKRRRSAIVVSTASDLDQIVTHSQNLWAKYNAIAKEHNQRVNWITVAKELGIHVKVREKYARMHSRACQRNFDFVEHGHWKIKDHPEIFQEPTPAEQKARMPPPLPPPMPMPMPMPIDTATAAAMVLANANANANAVVIAKEGTDTKVETNTIDGSGQGGVQEGMLNQETIQKVETTPVVLTARESTVAATETNDPMQNPMTTVVAVATAGSAASDPHQHHHHLGIPNSVDAAAAAATAAAVVDAAGVGGATIDMHHVVELAATAATTVAEGGSSNEHTNENESHEGAIEL